MKGMFQSKGLCLIILVKCEVHSRVMEIIIFMVIAKGNKSKDVNNNNNLN